MSVILKLNNVANFETFPMMPLGTGHFLIHITNQEEWQQEVCIYVHQIAYTDFLHFQDNNSWRNASIKRPLE